MRRPGPVRFSIRARLTLGTAIVAAIVLSVLAAATAVQLRDAAATAAAQLASLELRPYAADLRNQPDEEPDLPPGGLLVLIEAPDGTVRRDSMPAALAGAARRVDRTGDVTLPNGEFRVVSQTVTTSTGTWRLWAARDLTASNALLRGVLMTVLLGTPIAVLMMAITAWLVATAVLRPVDRMRSTADRLLASGATGLLPTAGTHELAGLGRTLNRLIADLRASALHEQRVTADAAHELRTPLAVLAAQIELAQRHPDTADLPAIRSSVDRMSRLADDLLTLSRADSVRVESGVRTPVAQLVTETMDTIDRGRILVAPGGPVDLDLELDGALDEHAMVSMDVTAFSRILTNLISNALATGSVRTVVVRLRSDDGALLLEVEDDGPGVPVDFLPFAFDRFSRPEGARSSASSGAGLGLALVRRLTELGGGTVTLRNREDGGAIAVVRLPIDRPPSL